MNHPHENDIDNMSPIPLENAIKDLAALDFIAAAAAADVKFSHKDKSFEVVYLGKKYCVSCEDGTVAPVGHDTKLRGLERLVILIYLIRSNGGPPSGKLVTTSELRKHDATVLDFSDSRIDKLAESISGDAGRLYRALDVFPGERSTYGDASVRIDILPRVSVTYVVWDGEDAIPPSADVLFDSGVTCYLPAEYATFLGSVLAADIAEICRL